MQPSAEAARALARRLRELREDGFPGTTITQLQLARVLSARRQVSVPAVSSWESRTSPKVPPVERLAAYATVFCTDRSLIDGSLRLFQDGELTDVERSRRDALLAELTELRKRALDRPEGPVPSVTPVARSLAASTMPAGPWVFPNSRTITIVCAEMPADYLESIRYTDRENPNYIEMYRYADLDALFELHGHIRAVNPDSTVTLRTTSDLEPDDYTNHLVLLGGVDWNPLTLELVDRLELPVRQGKRKTDESVGCFAVTAGGERAEFSPLVKADGGRLILIEDVAHFFRGRNPFNKMRTVTICNGMYGRGVLGSVRALTDAKFRDRNAEYLSARFAGQDQFSVLARVPVVNGKVLTPDWTLPATRLHEWPEADE